MSGVPGVRHFTRREAAGLSYRRLNPSDPEGSTCPGIPTLQGDPAAEWLRANDPRLRAEGIAEEVEAALAAEGLTLAEARAVFPKSGGRPSAALVAARERIARALAAMWDDGRRRDHMAAALDCDRKSLGRLMKPPHGPSK